MKNAGLKKEKVVSILKNKIDSNPDLKYYLDNDYVMELVDLLIEGIGEVVERNNDELSRNL